MKKRSNKACVIVLALGALSLAGCGGTGNVSSAPMSDSASSALTSSTASSTSASGAVQGMTADLSGFVGARAGQAEGGLRVRGYELVRTEGLTAYWYNASAKKCAEIVTGDGRYTSVTSVSPAECGAGGTASATPTAAEQACLAAIISETGNRDVRLIDSSFAEAGTLVRAAVGAQDAPWQCIAYRDGTTAGVQFMGSEGTL